METITGDEMEQDFQIPRTEFSITQVLLDAWRDERFRRSSVQKHIRYSGPTPPNLDSLRAVQPAISNRESAFRLPEYADRCVGPDVQARGTKNAPNPAVLESEPRASARNLDGKDFRARWLAAADGQSRMQLANRYGITEIQGLRIIGETWADQVPVAAIHERLALLVETQLPCNLEFNQGRARKIQCGRLFGITFESQTMLLSGQDWCSSVKLSEIDSAWIVTHPGSGRLESSIELYGRDGWAIVRLYGTSEAQENAVWHDLLGTLPTLQSENSDANSCWHPAAGEGNAE